MIILLEKEGKEYLSKNFPKYSVFARALRDLIYLVSVCKLTLKPEQESFVTEQDCVDSDW